MKKFSCLALFDLDNTLLPIDTDYEWSRYLSDVGAIDKEKYLKQSREFLEQYESGTLKIMEFLDFQLAPLALYTKEQLDSWHEGFMSTVVIPRLYPNAQSLVMHHLDRGDLCALVTATNEFITGPIAKLFRIDHLIATLLVQKNGRFSGKSRGTPSFREGKIERVQDWLQSMKLTLQDFSFSYFYSDSINDLPLLESVTNPVATNPDPELDKIAAARGWRVINLFK